MPEWELVCNACDWRLEITHAAVEEASDASCFHKLLAHRYEWDVDVEVKPKPIVQVLP